MVFVDRIVTGAFTPGSDAKPEVPAINEPVVEAQAEEQVEEPVEKKPKRKKKDAD